MIIRTQSYKPGKGLKGDTKWHGESWLWESADGRRRVVVDVGQAPSTGRRAALHRPEVVVLTHDDGDHVGGVWDFFAEYAEDRDLPRPELWLPVEWLLVVQSLVVLREVQDERQAADAGADDAPVDEQDLNDGGPAPGVDASYDRTDAEMARGIDEVVDEIGIAVGGGSPGAYRERDQVLDEPTNAHLDSESLSEELYRRMKKAFPSIEAVVNDDPGTRGKKRRSQVGRAARAAEEELTKDGIGGVVERVIERHIDRLRAVAEEVRADGRQEATEASSPADAAAQPSVDPAPPIFPDRSDWPHHEARRRIDEFRVAPLPAREPVHPDSGDEESEDDDDWLFHETASRIGKRAQTTSTRVLSIIWQAQQLGFKFRWFDVDRARAQGVPCWPDSGKPGECTIINARQVPPPAMPQPAVVDFLLTRAALFSIQNERALVTFLWPEGGHDLARCTDALLARWADKSWRANSQWRRWVPRLRRFTWTGAVLRPVLDGVLIWSDSGTDVIRSGADTPDVPWPLVGLMSAPHHASTVEPDHALPWLRRPDWVQVILSGNAEDDSWRFCEEVDAHRRCCTHCVEPIETDARTYAGARSLFGLVRLFNQCDAGNHSRVAGTRRYKSP